MPECSGHLKLRRVPGMPAFIEFCSRVSGIIAKKKACRLLAVRRNVGGYLPVKLRRLIITPILKRTAGHSHARTDQMKQGSAQGLTHAWFDGRRSTADLLHFRQKLTTNQPRHDTTQYQDDTRSAGNAIPERSTSNSKRTLLRPIRR